MSVTVFIADDHAIVRDGLRLLLEEHKGFFVIGEAANGRDAVRQAVRMKPDIVLMDIAMAEMNGIEASEQILKANPSTRIIILSMHASPEHIKRAMKAGVSGYLLKESAGSEVVEAMKVVQAGSRYLSPAVADRIWEARLSPHEGTGSHDPLSALSMREREVIQLVAEGKSSTEIAEILFISPRTVDTYRSRLMHKLNISDLTGLIKFAIRHGLITIEDSD